MDAVVSIHSDLGQTIEALGFATYEGAKIYSAAHLPSVPEGSVIIIWTGGFPMEAVVVRKN